MKTISVFVGIQEIAEYIDAITLKPISKIGQPDEYVVLNLAEKADLDPLPKLLNPLGKAGAKPLEIKEGIKRFCLLSTDSLIDLALKSYRFENPMTRQPITSVTKVTFFIDPAIVNPRQQEEIAKVAKRPRTASFGGGKIKKSRARSKSRK
jgi:hypothetical protein